MNERVYCLYRVSTTKQVDYDAQDRADLPVQRKACRAFAQKMGWTILREEQETGISGFKVSANDRDVIQLIKQHAEQGLFDILLVFMFDRLGRKSDETPFLVEWFVRHGIRVWSVNEGEQRFDCHTDRLTNYIRFWQADGESQKTSMRTKAALAQMVQEGRYRGGNVPYGYRLEKSGILNKRKHEVYRLVIDEAEAQVVRTIYDLCVKRGYGGIRIAVALQEQGAVTRTGGRWSPGTVHRILHNETYLGILKSGETRSQPFPELGIIRPEVFQAAQELIRSRTAEMQEQRCVPLHTAGQSLLSGNVFCGHCGGRLILTTNGKTVRLADGTPVKRKRVRYVCYNKTRHLAPCDGQTGYTAHLLDERVTELLHELFRRIQTVSRALDPVREMKRRLAEMEQRLTLARAAEEAAERAYESLRAEAYQQLLGKGTLPTDVLNDLLEQAKQESAETAAQTKKLQQELEQMVREAEATDVSLRRFVYWSEVFDLCDREVKKMICSAMLRRVSVRRGYELELTCTETLERVLQGADALGGT